MKCDGSCKISKRVRRVKIHLVGKQAQARGVGGKLCKGEYEKTLMISVSALLLSS